MRSLLVCGLAAGLIAGLLAAGTATLVGEPAVGQAIAFEKAHSHPAAAPKGMQHPDEDAAPVSRPLQKGGGLLTALIVYGLALGGLFALVFAFAYGRVGRLGPRVTAYRLAAGAFVAVYLVPFLKYPANPPSVGEPDTIGRRTALYAVMLGVSLLCAVAALRLQRDLTRRVGSHTATFAALAAYGVCVLAAGLALPGIHELPSDFPATTLWRFREGSMAVQVTVWTAIGLVFGYAAKRVMAGQPLFRRVGHVRAVRTES